MGTHGIHATVLPCSPKLSPAGHSWEGTVWLWIPKMPFPFQPFQPWDPRTKSTNTTHQRQGHQHQGHQLRGHQPQGHL